MGLLKKKKAEKPPKAPTLKRLTLAQLRKALAAEEITRAQFEERLHGLNYSDTDVKVLMALYAPAEE